MKKLTLILLAAMLTGCATAPGCYIGFALFPLGPYIHCGLDADPDDDAEEIDE